MQFTLRSLMAPGNLQDLAKSHDVVYEIHAPADEISWIKSHPTFAKISANVVIRFHKVSPSDLDARNAMDHWNVWAKAVARARADDVYVILIAPDHIFARGTFLRWAELFEQGYLAVFCTGYQVVLETVVEDLARRFPERAPIDLPVPELRSVILRHLHPIMVSMFRNSPRWIAHPEWHLRTVPGEGVMQRVLASHAYAFHPGRLRMTDNFCPVEQFDRMAFEPSCFFGVEPLLKQLGLYLRPWRMDDVTLSYYGVWAERFMAQVNLIESKIGYPMPIDAEIADRTRRTLQLGGDFYVGQMKAARAIVRVWRTLQEAGLYRASRWLAAAHLHGRLRRQLPMRGKVTMFVPADEILARLDPNEAARLLAGNCSGLIAVLRAHVAPGRHSLATGDRIAEISGGTIKAGDGRQYGASATGPISIMSGPVRIDDVEIYVIDTVLTPLALQPNPAGILVSALNRVRHGQQWLARHWRDAMLRLLSRHRRLYHLVLRLRERWFTRREIAAPESATVTPSALALYRRALALRGLQAMRDISRFYSSEVLSGGSLEYAPRAYLGELGNVKDEDIKGWLIEAIGDAPAFAEAWLELGYLSQEAGDNPAALEAFNRARILPATLARPAGQPDVRAIAATEIAKLLARLDRTSESLAVLDATPDQRYAPWAFHLARARVLLLAGRPDDALVAFERCLRWQSAEPRLTALLPQSVDEIKLAAGQL